MCVSVYLRFTYLIMLTVLLCTLKEYYRICECSQLEMMNSYPPYLLAALGFPPDAVQAEFLKHKKLEKLKVNIYITFFFLNNSTYLSNFMLT